MFKTFQNYCNYFLKFIIPTFMFEETLQSQNIAFHHDLKVNYY